MCPSVRVFDVSRAVVVVLVSEGASVGHGGAELLRAETDDGATVLRGRERLRDCCDETALRRGISETACEALGIS